MLGEHTRPLVLHDPELIHSTVTFERAAGRRGGHVDRLEERDRPLRLRYREPWIRWIDKLDRRPSLQVSPNEAGMSSENVLLAFPDRRLQRRGIGLPAQFRETMDPPHADRQIRSLLQPRRGELGSGPIKSLAREAIG